MPKKEYFLDKLNMKDYNNQLEEILEEKNFSGDTKNFLLSIFYKVEYAYNDYSIVKNIQKTKGEFLEEIIHIIKNNCDKIELIKPSSKDFSKFDGNNERSIVDKHKKSIISAYNEQNVLYAIFKMKDRAYNFKNEVIKEPFEELLTIGENMNAKEVIRDFDGWSWNVQPSLIENIDYNLIYQNILLLIGENIKTENEIKTQLDKIYSRENAKKLYILICKIALLMYIINHKDKLKEYSEKRLEINKKFDKMENQLEYLNIIRDEKKRIEDKIKNIDKCLADVAFLKKEYIKVNKKLEEDKKIFSISDFVEKIQKEKIELITNLQICNNKMKQENFVKEKDELQQNLDILGVLDERENIDEYVLKLQKQFILGLKEKIKKVQVRKDILDIIYKLRYYKFIPYKNTKIKDIEEIKNDISAIEKMVYKEAYNMNALNVISINDTINNEVISQILDNEMVELENVEIIIKPQNYQIELQIFDEENIEKALQYDTIEGLVARVNKKFRLFIK